VPRGAWPSAVATHRTQLIGELVPPRRWVGHVIRVIAALALIGLIGCAVLQSNDGSSAASETAREKLAQAPAFAHDDDEPVSAHRHRHGPDAPRPGAGGSSRSAKQPRARRVSGGSTWLQPSRASLYIAPPGSSRRPRSRTSFSPTASVCQAWR